MSTDASLVRLAASLLTVVAMAAGIDARDQSLTVTKTFPDGTTCSLLIVGGDGAAALADMNSVADAINRAFDGSQDMKDKVKEACAKWGGIRIEVSRDDAMDLGDAGGGTVRLDLGDLEKMADSLNRNEPKVRDMFRDRNLTATLAHEFDHLRDGPDETNHVDPTPDCAGRQTGPAVDDENQVMQDLGSLIVRTNYTDPTGDGYVDYRAGGVRFAVDLLTLGEKIRPVPQGPPAPPTQHVFRLNNIPDAPCAGNGADTCYPPAKLPVIDGNCGTRTTFNPKILGTVGGAVIGVVALTTGGGSTPVPTATTPPAVTTTPPVSAPPVTTTPPSTTPTPPTTTPVPPPVTANGRYRCMLCSIRLDGSNHNPTLRVCDGLVSDFTVQEGSLTIRHQSPFIDVTGSNYNATTGAFDLSGTGSIAGFNNVSARAVGTVNNETGRITFDYTLGANGVFPGGQPITYSVTLQKQ